MPIVKTNITHQVIAYLKENIENMSWKAGTKIPSENMLTEILGVSRASVRVAIQQFIAIGVLESVHGKGTFVKTNDMNAFVNNVNSSVTHDDCKDINKVLEFRKIVEPECCYLAAKRASEENIENMRQYLELMRQSAGRDTETFVRVDMQFHIELCKASGNPLILKCLSEVFDQTVMNHKQINQVFGSSDSIYYHTLLLRAMEEKDEKAARKLMVKHLEVYSHYFENAVIEGAADTI